MCIACEDYCSERRPRCRCGGLGHPARRFPRPLHSPSKHRLESAREFAKDFKIAVECALPIHEPPLQRVTVLGITWENDDADAKLAEQRLLGVFRDTYSFACESLVIAVDEGDPLASMDVFRNALLEFHDRCKKDDSLSIIVYVGYSSFAAYKERGTALHRGRYSWQLNPLTTRDSQRTSMGLELDGTSLAEYGGFYSGAMQNYPRVLRIFDCFWVDEGGSHVLAESLSCPKSSYGDALPNLSPPHEYIYSLADHLEGLNGEVRSVVQIHGEVTRKRVQKGLCGVPVHELRGESFDKEFVPSTLLARQPQTQSLTLERRKEAMAAMDRESVRVLFSIRLACDRWIDGVNDWQDWLTAHLPLNQPHSVRIESVQLSTAADDDINDGTTLLIASMPLELWQEFPIYGKRMYSFLSYMQDHRPQPSVWAKQVGIAAAPRPRRSFRLKREMPLFEGVEPARRRNLKLWREMRGRGGVRGGYLPGRGGGGCGG